MTELNETDIEEIARLISEGFTEGRLDGDESKHVYWKLSTEVWQD